MKKLLPHTIFDMVNEAKRNAIRAIVSFALILSGTIFVLIIMSFVGNKVDLWMKLTPAVLFSLMAIIQFRDVYVKVKSLSETALQAADSYEEEFNVRRLIELNHSIASQ